MNVSVHEPTQQVADAAQSLLHVICTPCHPGPGLAITRCGITKQVGPPNLLFAPPPDACVVCTDLRFEPCKECGR